MTLKDLGYTDELENYRKTEGLEGLSVGRVVLEHKERYVVKTHEHEYDAEVLGNLRFSAQSRADFPAVGDWVAISEYDDNKALIHKVFPRKTVIERQAVGKRGEKQVIAANIDTAFIVQAVDRDFAINRIERYITICHASGVAPVVLVTKTDLVTPAEKQEMISAITQRVQEIPVLAISNTTGEGLEALRKQIVPGQTYGLLGSSGVGKSTLVNSLSGREMMKTRTISQSTGRGRHSTTHRELHVLENGGILIDNPGMREVGITDSAEGLETTFSIISEYAVHCKFKDCTHTTETGCAVLAAVEEGTIDRGAYENYLKMEREKAFFESTIAERRKKDKDFGKMIKQVKARKPYK